MDAYIYLVKKLSLISVLSVSVTESNVTSAALFNDTRTTLWSRMLEQVTAKWHTLRLSRFIDDTDEEQFMLWMEKQLIEYSSKDMFVAMMFSPQMNENKGLHYYQLEPFTKNRSNYLYYNLSPERLLYIIQRLPVNTVFFPCKFSLYIEKPIFDLVEESHKREIKNEQQKKTTRL